MRSISAKIDCGMWKRRSWGLPDPVALLTAISRAAPKEISYWVPPMPRRIDPRPNVALAAQTCEVDDGIQQSDWNAGDACAGVPRIDANPLLTFGWQAGVSNNGPHYGECVYPQSSSIRLG